MQCLTHVLRSLVLVTALAAATNTMATEVIANGVYCESLAEMAKAGAEAKSRGESKQQWRTNLLSLKGYVVKNKDNVLYSILPKAVSEVDTVYKNRETPMNTYQTSYVSCMTNEYGKIVVLNY
ncbi:hypothetical protein D3C87_1371480 [compost metagenome]